MLVIIMIVLGLCLGSFVNALVWRLHEQTKPSQKLGSKKSKTKEQVTSRNKLITDDLSILKGHSLCPNCRHKLATKDLVPVLSWLWLRGKCRYCHRPISIQYPLVELTTALLFLVSYIYWPFAYNARGITLIIFWLVFLTGLVALAVYDLKWYLLPNKIVYFLMTLAVLQSLLLVFVFNDGLRAAGQIIISFVIGSGLFYILFQVSSGRWIGGGDVKLGMLLGLILANGELMLITIFSASLLGTFVTLPLLASGRVKRTSKVPFGPLLIAGAIFARLFGASVIHWYKTKVLLI